MKLSVAIRFIKRYRDQRDECADALREMTRYMVECHSFSEEGKLTPDRESWPAEWQLIDRARTVLAKVPTYTERLRRIFVHEA